MVPFFHDGTCALVRSGGRLVLPSGGVEAGEDAGVDAANRILMATAGFRRQTFHEVSRTGDHLLAWGQGDLYHGPRAHADADVWRGPPEEAARLLDRAGDTDGAAHVRAAAAARAGLTDAQYFEDTQRLLTTSYLRATTPEGGSGFGGDAEDWRAARSHIGEAIDRDGSFLDVGCANGLLMETAPAWCAERGIHIEPHGLDLSAELVSEARRRLPAWAGRIWVGNALDWMPPDGRRFDFVHVLLDVVPAHHAAAMIRHQLGHVAGRGGRLIVSSYTPFDDETRHARTTLERLGFRVDGTTRVGGPRRDGRFTSPSAWICV